jgi:citrate synthase
MAAMADLARAGQWTARPADVLGDAVRVLERMAWAAAGLPGPAVRHSSLPLHQKLASAWGVGAKAADIIRRALVLTADHELNASTYATRVVASTHAPLGACVTAGLAALVGPLHGGMTDRLRRLLADQGQAIGTRLALAEPIPAFGHRLYPDGDPRAADLLAHALPRQRLRRLIEAVRTMTGTAPNIDCALVALEQRLALPEGAALGIFAVGRTVGWIAHALEQWRDGTLIRPRAVYGSCRQAGDSDQVVIPGGESGQGPSSGRGPRRLSARSA